MTEAGVEYWRAKCKRHEETILKLSEKLSNNTSECRLRPCEINVYVYQRGTWEDVRGLFHSWDCSLPDGLKGIIETEDGKLQAIPYNRIRFLDSSVEFDTAFKELNEND